MHPAAEIQLAHRCVNQRVAGAALAPGGKAFRPVGPADGVVIRLEGVADDVRKAVENHEIKVAPDQLAEPDIGLGSERGANQFANRNGTEAQMHRQVGNALYRREVAQRAIARDAAVAEFIPQGAGAGHAGLDTDLGQICRLETDIGQRRHAAQIAAGQLPGARPDSTVCHGQPL